MLGTRNPAVDKTPEYTGIANILGSQVGLLRRLPAQELVTPSRSITAAVHK